jgi:hypothetical protein
MADVIRFRHPDLPDGELFFTDEEKTRLRANPFQRIEEQVSQSGNLTLVYVGQCRFIFTISMLMFWRDTVEKLDMLRDVQSQTAGLEPFQFWPYWLHDQSTMYEVLWTNVDEFFEQHAHGRIEANWEQAIVLKEIITGVCLVPS